MKLLSKSWRKVCSFVTRCGEALDHVTGDRLMVDPVVFNKVCDDLQREYLTEKTMRVLGDNKRREANARVVAISLEKLSLRKRVRELERKLQEAQEDVEDLSSAKGLPNAFLRPPEPRKEAGVDPDSVTTPSAPSPYASQCPPTVALRTTSAEVKP